MPQIIYTDTACGSDGIPLNTSPAATYATTDLSTILDLIEKGEIPCGTGVPIDVNWKSDQEVPWETDGPVSTNNWKQY